MARRLVDALRIAALAALSWLATACPAASVNRVYEKQSASFHSALVLPLNVMAAMPGELHAGSDRVEVALDDYLREHGRRVETIGYREARQAWRASVDDCRRESKDCDDFEKPARLLAVRLSQGREHDLVIVPYLRFKLAENCTEHVHWDGVQRPVERTGAGLAPEGPIAIRHVEMRAVSLVVYAFTPDGAKAFYGDGGLEVVDRLRATDDDDVVVAEPRSDLFQNPEWLREGVAVALSPLIPRARDARSSGDGSR